MAERIRIEMTGHGKGRVWIDDVERKNVVSIQFKTTAGGINEVEILERHVPSAIDIVAPALDIVAPAKVP